MSKAIRYTYESLIDWLVDLTPERIFIVDETGERRELVLDYTEDGTGLFRTGAVVKPTVSVEDMQNRAARNLVTTSPDAIVGELLGDLSEILEAEGYSGAAEHITRIRESME